MKYLVLIALLLIPSYASAQTPVSKEQANTYFASCVKNASQEKRFSQNAQQMFCACTAARLTQFFSVEDMQVMTSQTDPNARIALNKMIVDVYAPCMETPSRELYYAACTQTSGKTQQVCNCTADKISSHLRDNGSQIFADILSRNPVVEDPWSLLEADQSFNNFKETAAKSCAR